jgi:hypothetical protein
MVHGWNGEMSLATQLKNDGGEDMETQNEAASHLNCERNPGGKTFAK